MRPAGSSEQSILPANLGIDSPAHSVSEDDEGTFADLLTEVGALALLATGLTVVGYHFGGPLPRLEFWRTFAPLLLLPLAILLGVLLAPGGLLSGGAATVKGRVGFGLMGLALFSLVLVFLNGPTILLLGG